MVAGKRVLIVEDDLDARRMFRMWLMSDGFDVVEATNGLEALRVIDRERPDAVLLDLGLPLMSGHIVRQEIAAQAHTRHIPVVIVTGQAGPHSYRDVVCVLTKPVEPNKLVDAVRRCIASGSDGVSL